MDTLFHHGRLSEYLAERRARLISEIQRLPAEQILQNDLNGIHQRLLSKYMLTTPTLRTDDQYRYPPKEVNVDVRSNPVLAFIATGSTLPGFEVTIVVPFDGDENLLKFLPSTMGMAYPKGKVAKGEVLLTYVQVRDQEATLENDLRRDLRDIAEYLEWVAEDVERFNASLLGVIQAAISERRATLAKANAIVDKLGIPVKPPKR